LKSATARAAVALTAKGVGTACLIRASVVTLMEGVLYAMLMTKLKVGAAVLLSIALLSGGAGVLTYQKLVAQPPSQKPANIPEEVSPDLQPTEEEKAEEKKLEALAERLVTPDEKLKALLTAANVDEKMKSLLWGRVDAAKREVKARYKEYHEGRGQLNVCLDASRRLLEAERDLSSKRTDQVAAWEMHRQRMQDVYAINLARYNAGRLLVQDFLQSDYYRLDAEIGLERAKAQRKESGQSSE
jgi:hypothetical protein